MGQKSVDQETKLLKTIKSGAKGFLSKTKRLGRPKLKRRITRKQRGERVVNEYFGGTKVLASKEGGFLDVDHNSMSELAARPVQGVDLSEDFAQIGDLGRISVISSYSQEEDSPVQMNVSSTPRNSSSSLSGSLGAIISNSSHSHLDSDVLVEEGEKSEESHSEPFNLVEPKTSKRLLPMADPESKSNPKVSTRQDGIFSSLFSVAQNAAQHFILKTPTSIISANAGKKVIDSDSRKASKEEFPGTNKLKSIPSKTGSNSMERTSSFIKHLDSMLSSGGSTPDRPTFGPKSSDSSFSEHSGITNNGFRSDQRSPHMTDNSNSKSSITEPTGDDYLSIPIEFDHQKNSISGSMRLVGDGFIPSVGAASNLTDFGSGDLQLAHFDKPRYLSFSDNPSALQYNSMEDTVSSNAMATGGTVHTPAMARRRRGFTLPSKNLRSTRLFSLSKSPMSPSPSLTRFNVERGMELTPGLFVQQDKGLEVESTHDTLRDLKRPLVRSLSPDRGTVKRYASSAMVSPPRSFTYVDQIDNSSVRLATIGSGEKEGKERERERGMTTSSPSELEEIGFASTKRNYEFHTLFRDAKISSTEKLITDYSCAWSKNILLQGRLYISTAHLCFYSNILGYLSIVIIPLKEIVQIEKKNTAGIFPNGIAVHTLEKRYVFASFISRDTAFDIITVVWNQTILGTGSSRSRVDGDYPEGVRGPDLEYHLDSSFGSYEHMPENDNEVSDRDSYDDDTTGSSILGGDVDSTSDHDQAISRVRSELSISTLGPHEHVPTIPAYSTSSNEKKVIDVIFNGPLGKVANILFGDNTEGIRALLSAQKCFNISEIGPLIESKERTYEYSKPLAGPIGPNETICHITEKIEHFDTTDYIKVVQISKTPDIPSGNSFYVKTTYILSWAENNHTKMEVYFSVEWTGKSLFKSVVEKGAFDGIKVSMKDLATELHQLLKLSRKDTKERLEGNASVDPVSTLPIIGPHTHSPTSNGYTKQPGDTIVAKSLQINAPVGTVFMILFGDDSYYLRRILGRQKNVKISDIPKFVNGTRRYEYVKPLNHSLGPKQTRCLIEEKIIKCDPEAYVHVEQITKTPDVPSGGSFEIHNRVFLSWGKENTTEMMIVTNVKWTGRSWIKGPIEKGSLEGQQVSLKVLMEEVSAIISTSSTKPKQQSKRKTTHHHQKPPKYIHETKAEETYDNSPFVQLITPFTGYLERMDVVSFWSLMVVSCIMSLLFMNVFLTWFRSGGCNIKMLRPGKISIDGLEYNYVPSLNTLYSIHRNSVRRNPKDDNIVTTAEYTIWEWLDNRSSMHPSDADVSSQSSKPKEMSGSHRRQQLEEAVKITEFELEHLKERIDSLL